MEVHDNAREDYNNAASGYGGYASLPYGILESQLFKMAIGKPTGLRILDLGGGNGVHAREAIDAGAGRVDIVDISPEMLRVASDIEETIGRRDRLRFYEADVRNSLDHLSIEKEYDIVMANWVFEHAGSMDGLEGIWRNISTYLKPGGLFICVRGNSHLCPCFQEKKYGCSFEWWKDIPGGYAIGVVLHSDPPVEFEMAVMEINYATTEMYTKFGMVDVKVMEHQKADAIQQDPEFWKTFLENPGISVLKARKKTE
ncbi:hypothetical protein S40285_08646 [Stachybotrys chlorohalonatus IBT 40285]|uniref:Methyltransferase domain-containing protein n=1 Tax=Stachybotrys chlorohalonatus (strain IBT 40285) TaxID=1283841 RepID=A0A084QTI7_STAC4|nr:hypothetical protein S40285_08646 [Stachybotrys chlorohalonata IBT 40285]